MEIDKKNTNITLVGDYLEICRQYTGMVNNYYNYVVKTQATQKLGVYLPKLSTIETYNELIKYVEEMYVNGMILGDEFVMKPTEEQFDKIHSSYLELALMFPKRDGPTIKKPTVFTIYTSFGVKIIIK